MKEIKVIKILISVIIIILSFLALFSIISMKIAMPIELLLLGILNISNGYYSYIKNKKGEAILLILSGIFVIFVSVFTTVFK
ncbi:hypothetical protein [Clostridium sp.]|uniref:hypothetical protein n=1 Tax=Clostridium sp. TaxID=1506 RepID=UPI003D6CD25E